MAVDTSVIGKPTTRFRVVIEGGPVSRFAKAVTDDNPVYNDPREAQAEGHGGVPVPPTFTIAARYWGEHPELQAGLERVESDPVGEVMGKLMASGGLVLHGEQSFVYHRPIVAGDVLLVEGRIADLYEKESKGRTMTFIVLETTWTDEASGQPAVVERMNLIHRA